MSSLFFTRIDRNQVVVVGDLDQSAARRVWIMKHLVLLRQYTVDGTTLGWSR